MNLAHNRIAVVNGGAGGIGEAVVLRLARDGFCVVILDKNEKAGSQILTELRGRGGKGDFFAIDLTKPDEVNRVFEKIISDLKRVDVLVNLAGGTLHKKRIEELSSDEWHEVIDTNLTSTFLCCRAVVVTMKANRKGAIINTSSDIGFTGSAERTAYAASKAGIIGFSKSLALELAPFGIHVNVIAPGRTATKRVMSRYSPEAWAAAAKEIPMGRPVEPSEIAAGVAFLAGEDSGFITGHTLQINGGLIMP
jgi:NAD(P)-dependent dehydrogenase (short-subunit alcohol dehydrogenase family)